MFAEVMKRPAEDGTELFGLVHDSATERDTALVFVHGLGGNSRSHLADGLAAVLPDRGIAVVRGDLRESDLLHLDEQPSRSRVRKGGGAFHPFTAGVRDVDLWVTAARDRGYRRVVLFGHSLGSLRATEYVAASQRDEIVGLVLASTADLIALHASRYSLGELEEFLRLAEERVARSEGEQLMPPECTVGLMRQPITARAYVDRFGATPSWDIMDLFDRGSTRAFGALRKVARPILATYGTRNESVPSDRLGRTLELLRSEAVSAPSFEYKVFEGADHFYLNRSHEVAEVVADWVDRVVAPDWPPR